MTTVNTDFDSPPISERFALVTTASKNTTHVIRFHKARQVWIVSLEDVVASREPRQNGRYTDRKVRHPLKLEGPTLDAALEKAVSWMLSSDRTKAA